MMLQCCRRCFSISDNADLGLQKGLVLRNSWNSSKLVFKNAKICFFQISFLFTTIISFIAHGKLCNKFPSHYIMYSFTADTLLHTFQDNLLKTSTSVRYITLNILSLYTEVEEISPTTRQDITAALSAESTPLTLETYRDRLMHCSLLR